MSNEEQQLAVIRDQIDAIDKQIQHLLNERAKCAMRVAEVKLAARKDPNEPVLFYRPEREAQVLRAVMERNEGPLPAERVATIIRETMSACLALEETLNIGYLGPKGTFTQAAAVKHFGHAAMTLPFVSIDKIFQAVERGECRYGVVPIENSTEGAVNHTLDCLSASSLRICGEVELPINLNVVVAKGSDESKLSRICAHQQALAQSRQWLDTHFPKLERVAVSSNGEAVSMAEQDDSIAAIAGDIALDLYQVKALYSHIEDKINNSTRFIIIGDADVPASGTDRTCLMISARNESGTLLNVLEPFAAKGISLTRLISRPSHTENWAYVFFTEFEGHVSDEAISTVLEQLRNNHFTIKHLGSYPAAVI